MKPWQAEPAGLTDLGDKDYGGGWGGLSHYGTTAMEPHTSLTSLADVYLGVRQLSRNQKMTYFRETIFILFFLKL